MNCKSIAVSLFLITVSFFNAQLTAYYKNEQIKKIYSIVDKNKNTKFFFPSYNNFPYQDKGFRLTKDSSFIIPESIKDQTNENLSLTIRYYSKNVTDIHIYLVNNSNKRREIINNINPNEGFGFPSIISLNLKKGEFIKKIDIGFTSKDKEKASELILASLDLIYYKVDNAISPSNIFQKWPFDNSKYRGQFTFTPFNSQGVLYQFPNVISSETFKGNIDIINNGSLKSNEALLESVLIFLEDYPFYEVKKINREEFLASSKLSFEKYKNLSRCDLRDSLNSYLDKTIHDPHFKIRSACKDPQISTPIYAYKIGGKYIISAIFDEQLKMRAPLGSEILKINNFNLQNRDWTYQELNERLLKKTSGSKVSLEIKKPSGEVNTITYTVNEKYDIPDNFKPKNFLIKKINDSIAYFKINKITADLNIAYLNHYNLINNSKGLVLDFRGCSGGDFIAASQFLSYFIGKKFLFFTYGDGYDNKKYPIIVRKPQNSLFTIDKKKKIVLLADENTACVAEMMMYALRQYRMMKPNLVSKDRHTAGALAFAYEVNFPDEISVLTNALGDKRKIFLGDKIIEDQGIKPDLLIDIKSVEDLQPYNDLVLKESIKYLPN